MIAFAFAFGAWLLAMPYLLAAAGVAVAVWLVFRELRRQGEREIAERRRREKENAEVLARMKKQHNLRSQGDPRGVYGVAMPTVKKLERIERRRR